MINIFVLVISFSVNCTTPNLTDARNRFSPKECTAKIPHVAFYFDSQEAVRARENMPGRLDVARLFRVSFTPPNIVDTVEVVARPRTGYDYSEQQVRVSR